MACYRAIHTGTVALTLEAYYRAGWTAHREGIDDLFERVSCILARRSVTFRHYGGRLTP